MLVNSYHRTYGLDTIITRCVNNYGPRQHTEKLIPKVISNAKYDVQVPVYGTGDNVREWIHVLDHCAAIHTAAISGESGQIYNIGSGCEISNIELVRGILQRMDKPERLIEFVEDRKGHDFRYAIDSSKIRNLDWAPSIDSLDKFMTDGLDDTIAWFD